eukprot:2392440-Pleurochrysis_carterae.AAC.1
MCCMLSAMHAMTPNFGKIRRVLLPCPEKTIALHIVEDTTEHRSFVLCGSQSSIPGLSSKSDGCLRIKSTP